jgi:hypothetical protein
MLEQVPRATSDPAPPHPDLIPLVQFYSIEISSLLDGRVFVGIGATLSESDGELSNMDIVSRCVETLDDAFSLAAKSIVLAPPSARSRP